jgi:uncharacterized protein (TIGR00290 family)
MISRKPVVLSWSGGKDSALALRALRNDATVDVVALMTSVTADYDRISIHGVRRELLRAQAESVGLPLQEVVLAANCTNEAYETAFARALEDVRQRFPDVKHIAFGDLFLRDVRAYRERLLAGSGFEPVFPLWDLPTDALARDFIDSGFEARLVCVDTTQLDGSFAGALYDRALLAAMPSTIDPCGERGEFHTFVSNGPNFAKPVACTLGERVMRDNRFMYCDLI